MYMYIYIQGSLVDSASATSWGLWAVDRTGGAPT